MNDYIKISAVCPKLIIGNTTENILEITKSLSDKKTATSDIVLFPELSLTGYTCADLFLNDQLLNSVDKTIDQLLHKTSKGDSRIIIVGAPVKALNSLFNCAIVIQNGLVLGIVPKKYIPNQSEYYEKRWFSEGHLITSKISKINYHGIEVPFGDIVFDVSSSDHVYRSSFGIEICEDMWAPISPGTLLSLNGAEVILNLSASNELVAKSEYREQLVKQRSADSIGGYVYCSSGVHESTTDVVFGGHLMIAENGIVLDSNRRFQRETEILTSEIDTALIRNERMRNKTFDTQSAKYYDAFVQHISITLNNSNRPLERKYSKTPFVPQNENLFDDRCKEIFEIQSSGLAKRLEHIGKPKLVIGISGGLDSTHALLVAIRSFELIGRDPKEIICITMPGFGTTDRTYQNAKDLMQALGVTSLEIDIKEACIQHFKDIEFDYKTNHNVTFENVQARERTQILMDMANKHSGIVLGTGDLSELALGWCTYNGDQMSMYNVNSSVPKTLIQFLIKWVISSASIKLDNMDILEKVLLDILDTPISPELLPSDHKIISQKTEEIIGSYELNDFFLFYTLRHGVTSHKILKLAENAFEGIFSLDELKESLNNFNKRFFYQQFKRSAMPDGPKVGSVSLSPRGDWRMPSDTSPEIWLLK